MSALAGIDIALWDLKGEGSVWNAILRKPEGRFS